MITTTKGNKQAYAALFNDASKVLGIEESPITNLTQYFENIGTLSNHAIAEGLLGHTDAYKFIRLPIEINDETAESEPIFTIDANTRSIKIPAIFKNGISVEGDHGAEVLYFVIDRYFDAQDLANDTHIVIQWETAPSAEKRSNTEKGASQAFLVDKDSYPTKLVFGWVLDNRITKNAGTIKFSVRIYQVGEDIDGNPAITYSFSTTTATATINTALNYNLVEDVKPEKNEQLVLLRLKNSPRSTEGDAADPVFIVDLTDIGTVTPVYEEGDSGNILYYDYDLPDQTNLTAKLLVQANTGASEDTYNMHYSWYHAAKDGEVVNHFAYQDDYIQIESGEFDPDIIYYKGEVDTESGDIIAYSPIADAIGNIEDYTVNDEVVPVYQKFSSMIIDRDDAVITGFYRATAINLMGADNASETEGHMLRIPWPTKLALDITEQQSIILERDEVEGERAGDGMIELEVNTVENDGLITDYQWYLTTSTGEIVEEVGSNADTLMLECDENDLALYDKYYKVKVTITRNGDSINITSPLYRVTDAPHKVEILDEHERLWQRERDVAVVATATNLNDIVHDEVTYTWYYFNIDDPDGSLEIPDIDEEEAYRDACVKEESTENFLTMKPGEEAIPGGQYYCKVTNRVNGQTQDSYSKRYLVV